MGVRWLKIGQTFGTSFIPLTTSLCVDRETKYLIILIPLLNLFKAHVRLDIFAHNITIKDKQT